MIAYLLVALFAFAAMAAFASLVDSIVRARRAFTALRAEMANLNMPEAPAEFVKLRPRAAIQQVRTMPRPAPRLPRAAAA